MRVAVVLLLAAVVASCSSETDERLDRCRELDGRLTAQLAWDDIEEANAVAEEIVEIDCRELLEGD